MINYRQRALSQIKDENPWDALNPLFNKYISYIEDVCNKSGVRLTNFSYYVTRDGKFEEVYSQKIALTSEKLVHRIETLTGNVGIGKTTFIDYIRKTIIHPKYQDIITFYLDFKTLSESNAEDLIKERFIKTIEFKLIKLYFGDKKSLQKDYLEYLGYNNLAITEIPKLYKSSIDVYDFFKYIDVKVSKKYSLSKIILFTDNIDENNKETIKKFRYLINGLNACFRENFTNISTSIIVPIRDYNKSFFNQDYFKTNLLNSTPLPSVNTSVVIKMKLEEIKDIIENCSNEYTQYVDFSRNYHFQGGATITITKQSIVSFLQSIIDYVFNPKNIAIINLLKELSCNNLKILSSNILNFLQSKLLPLSELFDYHFNPDKKGVVKFDIDEKFVLRCLMAVRFPYYDIEISHIMNVFNLNNSHQRLDFSNIMCIPRLLLFLYNHINLPITANDIVRKFELYYYHPSLVKQALKKCFGYGLIESKFGITLSHLENNSDQIIISSAGIRYITDIVAQVSYLQYVCEDTPISPRFIIDIRDKYLFPYSNDTSLKRNRLDSVMYFITFLKKQEDYELDYIKKRSKDLIEDYLLCFSYRVDGIGIKLSEFIESKIIKEIEKLSTSSSHKA